MAVGVDICMGMRVVKKQATRSVTIDTNGPYPGSE